LAYDVVRKHKLVHRFQMIARHVGLGPFYQRDISASWRRHQCGGA
jgi:hypothetical protein